MICAGHQVSDLIFQGADVLVIVKWGEGKM